MALYKIAVYLKNFIDQRSTLPSVRTYTQFCGHIAKKLTLSPATVQSVIHTKKLILPEKYVSRKFKKKVVPITPMDHATLPARSETIELPPHIEEITLKSCGMELTLRFSKDKT